MSNARLTGRRSRRPRGPAGPARRARARRTPAPPRGSRLPVTMAIGYSTSGLGAGNSIACDVVACGHCVGGVDEAGVGVARDDLGDDALHVFLVRDDVVEHVGRAHRLEQGPRVVADRNALGADHQLDALCGRGRRRTRCPPGCRRGRRATSRFVAKACGVVDQALRRRARPGSGGSRPRRRRPARLRGSAWRARPSRRS